MLTAGISGHAAIHAESLYVSVVGESPEMYSLQSFALTKSYPAQKVRPYIMQVAVVNQGQWLVVGGDNGKVRVHATSTSKLEHTLVYEPYRAFRSSKEGPLVQVVAVSCFSVHFSLGHSSFF
jgi:hypothetical protein